MSKVYLDPRKAPNWNKPDVKHEKRAIVCTPASGAEGAVTFRIAEAWLHRDAGSKGTVSASAVFEISWENGGGAGVNLKALSIQVKTENGNVVPVQLRGIDANWSGELAAGATTHAQGVALLQPGDEVPFTLQVGGQSITLK